MKRILQESYDYAKPFIKEGKTVNYIPGIEDVDPNGLAASIIDKNGEVFEIGAVDTKFSMMSIVKVFLYIIALENYPLEEIKKYIGLKGSSKPYNSLLDLEMSEEKKPVNPYINAGAITTSYLIYNKFKEKSLDIILKKIQKIAGNDEIFIDEKIMTDSKNSGQANKAIIFSLQNNGVIPKYVDIFEVLNVYNMACCVTVNTKDLAMMSYCLSNGGKNLKGKRLIDEEYARISRTLMAIAGTYDYAGDFAVEIGLPAKSGVGGGIMATTNSGIGLATYSPALDKRGNSVAGIKMLEYISKKLKLGIY